MIDQKQKSEMLPISPRIFLSYSRQDGVLARRLLADLQRYELDVWLDTEELVAGQEWEVEITSSIENSTHFLVLLSAASLTPECYAYKEIREAFKIHHLRTAGGLSIIPIRAEDCSTSMDALRGLHWIDLFPEYQYHAGIKKLLDVLKPGLFSLRKEAASLTLSDAIEAIKRLGFYDHEKNPAAPGCLNEYEEHQIGEARLVRDLVTGLMWQCGGSPDVLSFQESEQWARGVNRQRLAGFGDWRLPTLEEAMSIVEPRTQRNDLHVDPRFEATQDWIWTCDRLKGESWVWIVNLIHGLFDDCEPDNRNNCRLVRSGRPA